MAHHHHPIRRTGPVAHVGGNRRVRPVTAITSGVISIVCGIALGIASIVVGALYATCIATATNNTRNSCSIVTPIILGVIGLVLIAAGISSIVGGIRMLIIMKNIAGGMASNELANATTVHTTPVPIGTTSMIQETTTTSMVVPQPGGYTTTPYQPQPQQPQYNPQVAYGQQPQQGYGYNPNQTATYQPQNYGQAQPQPPYPSTSSQGYPVSGGSAVGGYYVNPTQPYGGDNKV